MNDVLEFNNVRREYKKGVPVLKGVSFSVAQGEVVGLLGPNGAGKTTLIRIAMGMLFPQSGLVRVFGLNPTEQPLEVKQRIGYVPEDQVLPPASSVQELVAFHRYLFPRWDSSLEWQLMDQFGLAANSKIARLSKGQARQVALLCALCHRPELLILDEPAGGLDPATRRDFLEASIQLLNREGTAILFSSHYMSDVERIGGRIVLLLDGRIRLDSDLDRIREDICLAIVPVSSAAESSSLERVPGCMHTRLVFDNWHAVFDGSPEIVRERLRQSIGANGVRCVPLPLEELFIELVGSSKERHAR